MFKKRKALLFILLVLSLAISISSKGQENSVNDSLQQLSKKEKKKETKKEVNLRPRFHLSMNGVYSFLDTYIRFETPDNLFGVKISLEENLGLVNSKALLTSSFRYRITRRSGIYASYYGVNRNTTYTVTSDIPYLDRWIPQGSEVDAYFNTQVASVGYLYSILADPDAFLGAYFNIFVTSLNTGVKSDEINVNESITFVAPLPNIGLVMHFKMYKWFGLGGNIGAFFITLNEFNGKLYNFNLALDFTATRWLGFSLGYTSFNIQMYFPEQEYNATIGYAFRGPSAGMYFKF